MGAHFSLPLKQKCESTFFFACPGTDWPFWHCTAFCELADIYDHIVTFVVSPTDQTLFRLFMSNFGVSVCRSRSHGDSVLLEWWLLHHKTIPYLFNMAMHHITELPFTVVHVRLTKIIYFSRTGNFEVSFCRSS